MSPWSQWWGFLNATSSELHSPCSPSRCALCPSPVLGASLHHTAQSLPENTVKFICKGTGGHSSPTSTGTKCHLGHLLHTQTLSGSDINWNRRFSPKEISTHTTCMLLVHKLDTHSLHGVGLHPQPSAIYCSCNVFTEESSQNDMNFLHGDMPASLSV